MTLTQEEASLDLTEAMDSVAKLAAALESSCRVQFASFPDHMGSDVVIHLVGDFSEDGSTWMPRFPVPPEGERS